MKSTHLFNNCHGCPKSGKAGKVRGKKFGQGKPKKPGKVREFY